MKHLSMSTVPLFRQLLAEEHLVAAGSTMVEIGMGESTRALVDMAEKFEANLVSFDLDGRKLKQYSGLSPRATAILGDTLVTVPEFVSSFSGTLSLLFLDGAPSALQTFLEFRWFEPLMRPATILVIDNACVGENPSARGRQLPCRKGKVLVPYLQAHCCWELVPHPEWGGGMVLAILHQTGTHTDPEYERDCASSLRAFLERSVAGSTNKGA